MCRYWKGLIISLLLCAVFGLHKSSSSPSMSELNETLHQIFEIGDKSGVFIFNNTKTDIDLSGENPIKPDDAYAQNSETFKVRRNENGKLNVVFNDSPVMQMQRPTGFPNTAMSMPSSSNSSPSKIGSRLSPRCEDAINKGKPFCEEVPNYPQLKNLANVLSKFEVFFGDDVAQPKNITQRILNDQNEEFLCQSVEKIVYPKYGETKDNQWLYIINEENSTYKQGVRIEECLNPGKPCNVMEALPNGYTATCKQNYIYRHLVALSNKNEVIKDHFKLPSCCQCVLTHS